MRPDFLENGPPRKPEHRLSHVDVKSPHRPHNYLLKALVVLVNAHQLVFLQENYEERECQNSSRSVQSSNNNSCLSAGSFLSAIVA